MISYLVLIGAILLLFAGGVERLLCFFTGTPSVGRSAGLKRSTGAQSLFEATNC